jgi:ubiquinone/menaquinone biosynthesis C-methylase UbiE
MPEETLMLNLTQQLWTFFGQTNAERAKYLYNLCSDCLSNINYNLYIDVGTGSGNNALVFGANIQKTVALDLKLTKSNVLKNRQEASFVAGEGTHLPFRNEKADLVSAFSVIEYVDPQKFIEELNRVSTNQGTIIIQVPNRYSLIELHSGFPLFYYIPSKIRNYFVKYTPLKFMLQKDIPSIKAINQILKKEIPSSKVYIKKIKYPSSVIIPIARPIYNFCLKIGVFDVVPLGYVVIAHKNGSKS